MTKGTQTFLQKQLILNQHSEYHTIQNNNKNSWQVQFSTLPFNTDWIWKLADLLLKCPKIYATSKFDLGKINSPLHLPLKPDAVFKKQRASKVPIHLHDKVVRLLDILEQYEIISPVNKEEQPKGKTFC